MTPRLRSRAMRLFALLLRLLPAPFRRAHGEAMEATFEARLGEARGAASVASLLVREGLDVVVAAAGLRLGGAAAWLDDVGYALRSLARNPAHTLFAGATLALGMGATTAIFSALDSVLLRPLDYPHPERIVMAWRSQNRGSFLVTPGPEEARALESLDDVFEAVEPIGSSTVVLSGRGDATSAGAARVRPGFFALAGVSAVVGRWFTPEEADRDEPVVLVDEALWTSRFGRDPAVLGATLTVDGRGRTVVGVVPSRAAPPGAFFEPPGVWLPLAPDSLRRGAAVFGRLREGATVERAEERANAVVVADGPWRITLRSARAMVGGRFRESLLASAVAVALLLLVACANVANLLLARAEARLHESAVRSALGAGRGRLVRQHLLESVLLALGAGAVGVVLAVGFLEVAAALRPAELQALDDASIDGAVLLFAAAASLFTGAAFGIVPAFRGASARGLGSLRGGRTGESPGGSRLSFSLVAAEVALSFVLLTGTGLVLRTVVSLTRADVGFDTAGLLEVGLTLPEWRYPSPSEGRSVVEHVLERTRALPGVVSATAAMGVPPRSGIWFGVPELEGGEPPASDAVRRVYFMNRVGDGYFTTLALPILEGRAFTSAELADPASPAMVVSASFAAEVAPGGGAVGRRFRLDDGDWHTIVGVAGDVLASGRTAGATYPQVYFPAAPDEPLSVIVLRSTGEGAALADQLRALVRDRDGMLPPPLLASLEDRFASTIARQRFTLALLAAFAATALLLAAVGLYGVVAQGVERRTREIGILMSMGAGKAGIFRMVVRQGLATAALGVAVGVALAAAAARLLSAGLFGVAPADPRVWASVAAVLLGAALLATWLPARRAARVDPVEAMRG